jgi:pyruvate ferredoxin oxidoreductase alpha subunit
MDGFILTHAYERIDLPSAEQVDGFLPAYEPRQVLDPAEPVTIGALVGPEAFTEVKYLAHVKQMQALDLIPELSRELSGVLGREQDGLLRRYRCEDAETIVVALGSVLGTIEDAVDELRERGVSIGAVGLKAFRPFPLEDVRAALGHAARVIVIEKALALGIGGIVSQNVRIAIAGSAAHVYTVIAGLGGRPITAASVCRLYEDAAAERLQPLTFLDLNSELVERELERTRARRRSGPHAENMLRDIGVVAAGPV